MRRAATVRGTAMSFATTAMRCCGVRCAMRCTGVWCRGMSCARSRATCVCIAAFMAFATTVRCLRVAFVSASLTSVRSIRAASGGATSAVITSTSAIHKAMLAPSVTVAPASPRAHAQEDAVVEISRPIEAARCAGIRRIVVVAPGTYWLNSNVNTDLSLRRRCYGPQRPEC